MRLIPALDLRGGGCVRLHQGRVAAETRYAAPPLELLERYHALGARWVHVVDLDAALGGPPGNAALIAQLARQPGVRLQVGGGLRSAAALEALFATGVARAVLGSLAVEEPTRVRAWLEHFGPERLCLAFDVRLDTRAEPIVHTHGWLQSGGVSLWDALEAFPDRTLRHVLVTDIERDGALSGPNLDLYRSAVQRRPRLAWQASGGIRDARDLAALSRLGVSAAISGKALLEQRFRQEELTPYFPDASFPASTSATARS
jgi:phosphoribosylformimino-5-aminoimidazole carboxamide ribotide isomerase